MHERRQLIVNEELRIPLREIVFRYVRSSGPGGQNVNKVASKAMLRWSTTASPSLPDDVRRRFAARFASRLTNAGDLVLSCDSHRDRERNRDECLERLRAMVASVATAPKPRKKTRPSRSAKERRLLAKRVQSDRKLGRKLGRSWDRDP